MRVTKLLILIAWASTALANELPPELPFEALDGSSLTPFQEEVPKDSWVNNNNQAPNSQQNNVNGQIVNETPLQPDQSQQTEAVEQVAPVETVQAPKPKPKPKKRPKIIDKPYETTKAPAKNFAADSSLQSGITIKPKAGQTERIVIAKGMLNRIVTPYAEPKVLTVDNVETKIDGSVVYIATDSDTPVSLFVSDSEGGGATSLQLLPEAISAPVEIRIEQDRIKSAGKELASSNTDAFPHQDLPYVSEIKSIMQSMGKQQIPQGFTMEEVTSEIRSASICHSGSLNFTAGQLLSSHDSKILVMIAQNNGNRVSFFEEAFCAGESVMAVAAWPKVQLNPGEKTEVYILMRLQEGKSGEEFRPGLLGMGD